MIRLAADENLQRAILRGLRRRNPSLDVIRVEDAGLGGTDDPTLLEWAARENRVVLTHDVNTMPKYAYDRIKAGLSMPGVIVAPLALATGRANRVIYLPLAQAGAA
jgi:hypothetical protein